MADNTYFVSALASTAGANKRHLTFWNGTAVQRLRVLYVQAAGAPVAAVTGLVIPLSVVRITTIPTGGTLLTVIKADTVNSPNVPGTIECRTGATGGAAEEASAFGVGCVTGEETGAPSNSMLYQFGLTGGLPMILEPGSGLVVKQGALASAGAVSIVVCVGLR